MYNESEGRPCINNCPYLNYWAEQFGYVASSTIESSIVYFKVIAYQRKMIRYFSFRPFQLGHNILSSTHQSCIVVFITLSAMFLMLLLLFIETHQRSKYDLPFRGICTAPYILPEPDTYDAAIGKGFDSGFELSINHPFCCDII